MTTEMKPRLKITYATLRADNEELHALYEQGVQEARAGLGAGHKNYVDGRWIDGSAGTFEARSPIDRELVLGRSRRATAATPRRPSRPRAAPRPRGARPRGATASRC